MLRVNNVIKTLGGKQVLNNINLHVNEGSIYGLVGPNGAGKTTLIRTITGILRPDKGEILINNIPLNINNNHAKKYLGYVTDNPNYFPQYSIKQLSELYRGAYENFNEDKYYRLLNIFDLNEKSKMKNLSKGMKTRVSLLLNLALNPKLLILDEPTSGLDPVIREELFNILVEEASENGTTLFISTHNLDELERICDHIGLIYKGRMISETELDELKDKVRKIQVVFNNELPQEIKRHPDIYKIEQLGRVYRIIVSKNFSEVYKLAQKCNPVMIESVDMSLNEIFISQVGGEGYVIKK